MRDGILDPQGKAIEGALASLGFGGVGSVRQGKIFDVELAETDPAKAKAALGWTPKVTFEQLIQMMVDADLRLARREKHMAELGDEG